MVLLFVIRTIDSAAKQIAVPEIEVFFENHLKTIKAKAETEITINFCAKNKGEDVAEDLTVFIHFPKEFSPKKLPYYSIHRQTGIGEDFPNYNSIKLDDPLMHLDIFYSWEIEVITPKTIGNYVIPVYIHEKKTGLTKYELTIEVIE